MENHRRLSESREDKIKKVKVLVISRVIIITLLLSIILFIQLKKGVTLFITPNNLIYYFIAFTYFITLIYVPLLNKTKDVQKFAFVQHIVDVLLITLLIYLTGGIESFFVIAYIFSIISGSIILYKRGAYFIASMSSIAYGALLDLEYYGLINPLYNSLSSGYHYSSSYVLYRILVYVLAFFIVALLSSHLAEELRRKKKELIQKQDDYEKLEAFNRDIIQSLDSGLLTIDSHGKITSINRTAQRILSLDSGEMEQSHIQRFFPDIDETLFGKEGTSQKPNSYQRYETTFVDRRGKTLFLGFSLSPLRDNTDQVIGKTFIFQDITKFKEMEEQIKRSDRMATIGQFAAGIAHEIRNPLTSLSGSIQVLKEELELKESNRHLMEIILRESERLNNLITDFLLFAQPPGINKEEIDISQVIDETLQLFENSPGHNRAIKIVKELKRREISVLGDPHQLRQVFWNLFINAAQIMPNGGELRVELETVNSNESSSRFKGEKKRGMISFAKISVSDTGDGIKPGEKEKIFEPFFTTKEGGTGLGLAIVHRIVENHAGFISVNSQRKKGTTFEIFLPMEGILKS
ncbi:MAG: PAS domain S-box protein [Syntrophobacterales bacterium]|nr:MAG: PAS domain S-box protein [Syntrophobacterales bacterium]